MPCIKVLLQKECIPPGYHRIIRQYNSHEDDYFSIAYILQEIPLPIIEKIAACLAVEQGVPYGGIKNP
jgi:hypothetical protein